MLATATPALSRSEYRTRPAAGFEPAAYLPTNATAPSEGAGPPVRVLVVFEFQYRSYGDAIAGVIRELRPRAEVAVADPVDLRAEVTRVCPHLVISSQPNTADPARTPAWVQLPHEPGLAGAICFGGRCLKAYDLALGDLLDVVDRTEGLIRAS
ncbi:hypothetical protein GBA63_21425 [Rubrobacter tropicus]|uniref:Uncharacterized protein n=1 Tax=Rubrobacter tropicus TaxID=2653851 RepID=A0A6G8QEK2_9ACTN|nr:hypothetical protein [Rubrobacter tropicus]QIN84920.1 hypothetical protein GBA63_21425 [Rubrobacter tropicus]